MIPWWLNPWREVRRLRTLNAQFHEHDQAQMRKIAALRQYRDELEARRRPPLAVLQSEREEALPQAHWDLGDR